MKLREYFLSICSDENVNSVSAYIVYVSDTLQYGAMGWRGGEKLLNNVIILVSLLTKSILVASENYGWTPDVTWIILTISLRFWALIM